MMRAFVHSALRRSNKFTTSLAIAEVESDTLELALWCFAGESRLLVTGHVRQVDLDPL